MIVDNTINYAFHFKTNRPIDGMVREATLTIAIRSYQYENEEKKRYTIATDVEGNLLVCGAFYLAAKNLPKQIAFKDDIRNTTLYKLLRDHCVLMEIEYPKVVDENQVFCYMNQLDFHRFMDPCDLAVDVDLPEFEIIKRVEERFKPTERDLPSFV